MEKCLLGGNTLGHCSWRKRAFLKRKKKKMGLSLQTIYSLPLSMFFSLFMVAIPFPVIF